VAINVTFSNISQANSEILKAFNSNTSAKALEAYQPLTSKQRKLEKLRALQILKKSSDSATLADISLETDSLAVALKNAEGATLQAMLNLLSAKMIEQNKYIYSSKNQAEDIKAKVKQKLEERQEQQQGNKKQQEQEQQEPEENAIDKLVNAVVTYFEEIRDDFIEKYKKFLDAVSLENLQKAFKEGVDLVRRYTLEAPVELFNEYVVEPINDFRENLQKLIENSLQTKVKTVSSKTFSANDIKSMLNKSFVQKPSVAQRKTVVQKARHGFAVDNAKLESSIDTMSNSLILKKKIKSRKHLKVYSADELRLALHS
jgi:hypothetical protein